MPRDHTIPKSTDWRAGALWALDAAEALCSQGEDALDVMLGVRRLRAGLLREVAVDDPDGCSPGGTRAFVAEAGDVVIVPPASAAPGALPPVVVTRSSADGGT
jgi:hypothetical protein